ncbi:hypothetical protein MMC06_003043 [Schaereria dolodes]|nr:hypothetical protein [Schaereria dolodes]
MRFPLQDRLLRRELGSTSRYSDIWGIYSDRAWIDDLDIVNELGGHSGCVNALSWSTSGRLLASGSDDQHLNIHTYQPESSAAQFALTTTVATGHTANIFSVKFMPHSEDRTLVTCAGDSEVRVFDIEYSGRSTIPSSASNLASSVHPRSIESTYKGVRYLSEGNTNARIYRSHADRVKRIVTESSPHLFLTCSEDGEVRQWDLRLSSSAYPAPRGGRGFMSHRPQHDNMNVPSPLISYKRYHLDLNTISCSASQPHYIALGGAHLHCFLHDRRMLGRDRRDEKGEPGSISPANLMSEHDDDSMGQATRCVRRFAPNGQKRMGRTDNGHITACKISDANPNEMIASWSGDHVYSFDLVRSPDVRDQGPTRVGNITNGRGGSRPKESKDRKRKRKKENSTTSIEDTRRWNSGPRPRRAAGGGNGDEGVDVALRVRYENGQSEDITIDAPSIATSWSGLEKARDAVLDESQKRSLQIAKSLTKVRKLMFSLDCSSATPDELLSTNLTHHTASFTSILGVTAACIPEVDDITRNWKYPVNPIDEEVMFQRTLRSNRDSSRRFFQAAGTLARVLGGKLQTPSFTESTKLLSYFNEIVPGPNEGPDCDAALFNRAFGGLGITKGEDEGRLQDSIKLEETDEIIDSITVTNRDANDDLTMEDGPYDGPSLTENPAIKDIDPEALFLGQHQNLPVEVEDRDEDEEVILMEDLHNEIADHIGVHSDNGEDSDQDDQDNDSDGDEDSTEFTPEERQFMWQSASDRGKLRESVEKDVPAFASTRSYRGHCNVKTVKDVNFFGLQDEYVVSGSDSGHLFIWDKKTSQLVNILEGDGEVVNVVQGHPYEPLLAVSGIDHTIKIFSPDAQAQDDARNGINLASSSNDSSGFSSLTPGRRRAQSRRSNAVQNASGGTGEGNDEKPVPSDGLTSRKRIHDSYQIISQNDIDRRGGNRDAYITRGMLAQFAARLRARNAGDGDGNGELGEEVEGGMGVMMLDDNCEIM